MTTQDNYAEESTDRQNDRVLTLAAVMNIMTGFFAALGLIFLSGIVGLYLGGFFHWLASKSPNGFLAFILG